MGADCSALPYCSLFLITYEVMARSSRHTESKPGRMPLTKDMLLPLSAGKVRALSLENHLALAAMRSGHDTISLAMHLLRILYLAWFLRDATEGERYVDLFCEAETALARSRAWAEQGQGWSLSDADHEVLADILALHDLQLASVPSHCYVAATVRLQRFLRSDDLSSPLQKARNAEHPKIGSARADVDSSL